MNLNEKHVRDWVDVRLDSVLMTLRSMDDEPAIDETTELVMSIVTLAAAKKILENIARRRGAPAESLRMLSAEGCEALVARFYQRHDIDRRDLEP